MTTPTDAIMATRMDTNVITERVASIADRLRLLAEILQQTPEPHGPIYHFMFPPEKRSFLVNDEVWVDDGEECFICKEALVNQSAPCIGDPPPDSEDKPCPCYPLRLWPCDHIVGDQCFKGWVSNYVNSEAGLCLFCRQPLLVAPGPQSILKKVEQYFSSSQLSSIPDQLVHNIRDLQLQLATQPLNALQIRELAGPMATLYMTFVLCSRWLKGPLATILSSGPMMNKAIAVLNILAQPFVTVIGMDALGLFLEAVVYGLESCLRR